MPAAKTKVVGNSEIRPIPVADPSYLEQENQEQIVKQETDSTDAALKPQAEPLPSLPKWEPSTDLASRWETAEIAMALARAKRKMGPLLKDRNNPAFKSKYATLASTYDTISDALLSEDIVDVQTYGKRTIINHFTGELIREYEYIKTTLIHGPTGQQLESELELKPVDDKAQTLGSLSTYLRRYMLQAMMGIAPEDDDGNAASGLAVNRVQSTGQTGSLPPRNIPEPGPNVAKLRAMMKQRGIQGSKAAEAELSKIGYDGSFLDIDETMAGSLIEKLSAF